MAFLPKKRRVLAASAACLLAAGLSGMAMEVASASASVSGAVAGTSGHVVPDAAGEHVAASAALTTNWYASAPYYDVLDSTGPDLTQVMGATGQKAFDISFILADGGCTAAWNGTDPVPSDTQVAGVINQVRAAGGDVIVSAGGYAGTKLGQVCGTAQATAAAYQQVVTAYGLHAMDFDLEEPEIENTGAIANEVGAAQILQKNNPGLFISITMPSIATGANYFGGLLLDEAKSLGFTPDNYTIMPFDGGFNGASAQIAALQGFNGQLMSTFGWTSAQAYAHEGFSGINGRSDTAEYFHQSDFQSVLSFAQTSGLGRFTFWSVNRDRQCTPPDNNGAISSECSSVPQNPWDFTAYTVAFAKNAPVNPPPSPTPTPTPTSTSSTPPGGGCTAAAWVATQAYTAGSTVTYNGHTWTASQWNDNEAPGGSSGAWTDNGPC